MSCYKALIIVIVAAILCGCSDSARVDAGADEPETGSSPLARLGQYDVTREGGRLRISRNGRTVWETTDAPVTLARTDLDVSEERALFDIDENSEQRCTGGTFDSLSGVADDIRLSGRFADGPCENVGYTLRLTAADGQVRFDLKSDEPAFNEVSLALAAPANEPFYGFGEQTELNLRGLDVPVIVQEQGIGRGGSVSDAIGLLQQLPVPDAQKALIATFANAQGNALTTYYAAPLTVTGDGAGLLLENTGYSRFDLRADDHIEVHAFAGRLVGRLYGGDNLLETVTQATAYTGRMPPLPAWTQQGAVIGIQGGTATVRQRYQTLKDAGVPITGLWLQDWAGARSTFGGAASMTCWNWELDDDRYPQWDQLRQDVAADGVRLLGYFNPYLVADVPDCNAGAARNLYQEAKAAGYLVKNASGEPYQLTITDFDAGIVDLTNPQAYDWLKHIIETQVEKNGFSGWMADFAEGLPFDAVLANGESGRAVHNRYPVLWTQLNDEVVRDLGAAGDKVFFRRSGFTRSPAYATLFWAGDQATVWDDRDGLQSAITSIINGGFSGMALNHSDVGGYTSLGLPVSPDLAGYIPAQFKLTDPATGQVYAAVHRTPELLLRWSEFAAFTAMMRTHEGLAPALNAQVYSSPQLAGAFARMVAVYRAFAPYRATLMDQAENKGWPLVRHPLMNAGDPWFVDMTPQNIEFMLGAHVLVAPVVTPDTDTRAVHLPQGEWTHLWSGHTYSVGAAGQTFTEAHAGLGAPPVYVDMDDPVVAGAVDALKAAAVVQW